MVNGHGLEPRGAAVVVDAALNASADPSTSAVMTIVLNTAESGGLGGAIHPVGSTLPVLRAPDGTAYVEIESVGPAETLILTNHPIAHPGDVGPEEA